MRKVFTIIAFALLISIIGVLSFMVASHKPLVVRGLHPIEYSLGNDSEMGDYRQIELKAINADNEKCSVIYRESKLDENGLSQFVYMDESGSKYTGEELQDLKFLVTNGCYVKIRDCSSLYKFFSIGILLSFVEFDLKVFNPSNNYIDLTNFFSVYTNSGEILSNYSILFDVVEREG